MKYPLVQALLKSLFKIKTKKQQGLKAQNNLGSRYYNAEIGRFTSRDPVRSGRSWFVYCSNNPLIYMDPTGYMQEFGDWVKDPFGHYKGQHNLDDPNLQEYWGDVYSETLAEQIFDELYDPNELYDDPDSAAAAFGMKYNIFSIAWNIELGALIIENRNGGSYFLGKVYTDYSSESVRHHAYGTVGNVVDASRNGRKVAAVTHSHAAFTNGAEVFSPGDLDFAFNVFGIDLYVVTPGGQLRLTDVSEGEIHTLDRSMPKDKNYRPVNEDYYYSLEQGFLFDVF